MLAEPGSPGSSKRRSPALIRRDLVKIRHERKGTAPKSYARERCDKEIARLEAELFGDWAKAPDRNATRGGAR
ncbi:MAG: hypothetical protein RIS45_1584 [Planctomycetota bacterium]|jgi:hypothetical protein